MGSESPSEAEGSSFHAGDLVISEVTGEFLIVMSVSSEFTGILGTDMMRGYFFGTLYRAAPGYLMLCPAVLRDPTRCAPPEGDEELPGYVLTENLRA